MPEEKQLQVIGITDVTTEIENHKKRKERADTALLTTGKLVTVKSDDDLTKSNLFRKKINAAVTEFKTARLAFTKKLDEFKAELMKPEKALIDEGDRIKQLEEAFLAEKAAADKKRQAEIRKAEDKKNEVDRIKIELKANIPAAISDTVRRADDAMRNMVMKSTKKTFPEVKKLFSNRLLLKQDKYDLMFKISYNESIISPEEYAAIVEGVKKTEGCDFAAVEELYLRKMDALAKIYRDMIVGDGYAIF